MSDNPKYVFTHKVGDKVVGKYSKHPYEIVEDLGNTMLFKSAANGSTRLAAKIFCANAFVFVTP